MYAIKCKVIKGERTNTPKVNSLLVSNTCDRSCSSLVPRPPQAFNRVFGLKPALNPKTRLKAWGGLGMRLAMQPMQIESTAGAPIGV